MKSFGEFWPFYLSEHRHETSRQLHFAGTTLVYACLALAVFGHFRALALAPVIGYGFAWIGHFVFEKNRPATFRHPIWSLRGDFRMHRLMLLGRLEPELSRLGIRAASREPADKSR